MGVSNVEISAMHRTCKIPQKKYTLLNMQQRLDVLKDLQETSLSTLKIAKKYGVDAKTIYRIKKNAAKINTFENKSKREKKLRKIMKPVYDDLDERLLAWFVERRTLGDHLTDALMLEKASEIKDSLPSCSHFKVSRGWLSKFKRRHGIRLLHKYEENVGVDQDGANTFIDDFKKLIQKENINLENVYNMDETGLVWKALPTKTLAGDEERNISDYKLQKDRITIGLCANILGTHKLMPLVIYRYKNPRALKHDVSLPVIFKSQPNAWMNRPLFLDWFENHFKPSVREYQEQRQISGKVILLVDNCEGYKVSSEIQEDEHFKIMCLSPNRISLIQPMDQGIIEETKRVFRHKLLQRVLTYDNGVNEFYKDYTLKDCIYILSKSWSEVTESNIRNAWNKIIESVIPSNHVQPIRELQPDWQDMISVIKGEDCTQECVTEYLSVCEEAERTVKEEQIEEESVSEEELIEEPNEIIYAEHNNETVRNELRRIFEQLIFYSAKAPTCIQCMVQGLRIFFLGKEY